MSRRRQAKASSVAVADVRLADQNASPKKDLGYVSCLLPFSACFASLLQMNLDN